MCLKSISLDDVMRFIPIGSPLHNDISEILQNRNGVK